MRNFLFFFALSFSGIVLGQNIAEKDPQAVINTYQVDQNDRVVKKVNANSKNEVVLENSDGARIEALSKRPIQWIYKGKGTPLYKITNSFSPGRTRSEGDGIYKSTIFIYPLKEFHTGQYECRGTDNDLELLSYVYVYVPGPSLFVDNAAPFPVQTQILLPPDLHRGPIIIPCAVSSPHYIVKLEKVFQGERSEIGSKLGSNFDPREGFTIILSYFPYPEGKYVCYGQNSLGLQRRREYVLMRNDTFASHQADQGNFNPNSRPQNLGATPFGDGGPKPKCETHTDCPDNMSCYVDRICRDTCKNSMVGCGPNSLCRVVNHRPECYCPRDYVGDARDGCFKGNPSGFQGDEDPAERFTPNSSPRPGLQSRPTLSSSAPISPPNQGTIHRPRPLGPEPLSSQTGSREPSISGSKAVCKFDQDCGDANLMCRNSECVDKCLFKLCGIGAECFIVQGLPSCRCKGELVGNPNRECLPPSATTDKPEKLLAKPPSDCSPDNCREGTSCPCSMFVGPLGRDCQIDQQCTEDYRCETGVNYRKCVDPCDRLACPRNSKCTVTKHRASCV